MIDGSTRLCCLLGDPVEHTMSPQLHNEAFKHLGLNYVYMAFRVRRDALRGAVDGLRAFDARGFNITLPHKVSIMPLLDRIDHLAQQTGAVNTIVNDNGTLIGYNTDVHGFLLPLKSRHPDISGSDALLVGAGGAARACATALALERCRSITILNRTPEKAEELSHRIREQYSVDCRAGPLSIEALREAAAKARLLVNTTSVGTYPKVDESPLPRSCVRRDMVVYDIVYNPIKTKLLRFAEDAGAACIPGYEMLVEQATVAFKLWTGVDAPRRVMVKAVVERLGGRVEGEG